MSDKKRARLRRAQRARAKIRELGVHRLCVFRSPQHIYAQIIVASDSGDKVIASASTLGENFRGSDGSSGNVAAAELVGRLVAERALQKGVSRVAFDRSGFKYHGRVKALADAARAAGLAL